MENNNDLIREIIDSLYDRKGFRQWWDDLDREVRREIEDDILTVIKRYVKNKVI